jgi:hypothetical protein
VERFQGLFLGLFVLGVGAGGCAHGTSETAPPVIPALSSPPPIILPPPRVTRRAGDRSLYPRSARTTPGALDPRVTEDAVKQTICDATFLEALQPSIAYADATKDRMRTRQRLPGRSDNYQLDHLVPLELGGSATSPRNLWLQPYGDASHPLVATDKWPDDGSVLPGAHQKDEVETRLKNDVCDGRTTLKEAQDKIRTDWYGVYLTMHAK